MGQTVVSETVRSATVPNDGDGTEDVSFSTPESVAFASFGTGPALNNVQERDGICRLTVTSGTGVPAIAANNIQLTYARAPRAVFLRNRESAPGYHVASIAGAVVNIGTKVAPAASTQYVLDLIVLF